MIDQEIVKAQRLENRANYITRVQDQIVITGNSARCPSSDDIVGYRVDIEDGKAVGCTCADRAYRRSYCKHMEAVDCLLYVQNFAAIFHSEEQEVAEQPAPAIEVNALLLKNRELYRSGAWNESGELTPVSVVMPNEYDLLAETKTSAYAYGSCGHLVHVEDAGEECGVCRCKYYA